MQFESVYSAQGFSARVELIVFAFLLKQLIVGTALNDMAGFQDHDDIAILNCGKTMGDNEDRSAFHDGIHSALNQFFSAAIDGRSRLIKDQNRGIRTSCAGNGEQLPLTLG